MRLRSMTAGRTSSESSRREEHFSFTSQANCNDRLFVLKAVTNAQRFKDGHV